MARQQNSKNINIGIVEAKKEGGVVGFISRNSTTDSENGTYKKFR
tara:strand:- start:532 stop:666 length:135 start_codon:yes stop_codon:yes gene_type:complete